MDCPLAVLACKKPDCLTLVKTSEGAKGLGTLNLKKKTWTRESRFRKVSSSKYSKHTVQADQAVKADRECFDQVSSRSTKPKENEEEPNFQCKCDYCCIISNAIEGRSVIVSHGSGFFSSCVGHHLLCSENINDYFCTCDNCRLIKEALEGTTVLIKHGGGQFYPLEKEPPGFQSILGFCDCLNCSSMASRLSPKGIEAEHGCVLDTTTQDVRSFAAAYSCSCPDCFKVKTVCKELNVALKHGSFRLMTDFKEVIQEQEGQDICGHSERIVTSSDEMGWKNSSHGYRKLQISCSCPCCWTTGKRTIYLKTGNKGNLKKYDILIENAIKMASMEFHFIGDEASDFISAFAYRLEDRYGSGMNLGTGSSQKMKEFNQHRLVVSNSDDYWSYKTEKKLHFNPSTFKESENTTFTIFACVDTHATAKERFFNVQLDVIPLNLEQPDSCFAAFTTSASSDISLGDLEKFGKRFMEYNNREKTYV